MNLTTMPVRVGTDHDEEGCLVFSDDRLQAVLVRLSDQHGELAGFWFLEAGFGGIDAIDHPTFADLDAAQDWIARRIRRVTSGQT
jgi:hypothetical protein